MWHHDDVIKWKHFPRYWPFVRGIHRYPVNSAHKGQWRGALMFSLICARINGWVNTREAGDLRRYHVHYDVIVMVICRHYIRSQWGEQPQEQELITCREYFVGNNIINIWKYLQVFVFKKHSDVLANDSIFHISKISQNLRMTYSIHLSTTDIYHWIACFVISI